MFNVEFTSQTVLTGKSKNSLVGLVEIVFIDHFEMQYHLVHASSAYDAPLIK